MVNSFSSPAPEPSQLLRRVRLPIPGWSECPQTGDIRSWLNNDQEAITLTVNTRSYPWVERGEELEIRNWTREFAKVNGGGLIEVHTKHLEVSFIFKRLKMPAYFYTGMLLKRTSDMLVIWTTTACELGTTGVREAVVTAALMNEGKLAPQDYELRWARDPYEPACRGVHKSVLRFMSDDEAYDEQFPQHPLSKVRRVLATLSGDVKYDSQSVVFCSSCGKRSVLGLGSKFCCGCGKPIAL